MLRKLSGILTDGKADRWEELVICASGVLAQRDHAEAEVRGLNNTLRAANAHVDHLEAELTRLREHLKEQTERVQLFARQLSVQEERTGSWHQACDKAEAEVTRLTTALQQLQKKWRDYRGQRPRSFDGKSSDEVAIERENTLMDVFIADLASLAADVRPAALPPHGKAEEGDAEVKLNQIWENAAHGTHLEDLREAYELGLKAQGWQPISTAPKDKTWFLGWNSDMGIFIWRDGPGLITGEDPQPTHWQPLPSPPPADVEKQAR